MTMESIAPARRAACARPAAPSTSPSPRNTAYATLLLNASQLRSPTIDHQTVTPVQLTRRTSDQTSTAPERPVRGAGRRPNTTARSAPTSRRRAAPPTGSVPPTPDPSPANVAPSSAAPTRAARTPAPVPDARSDGSDAESMAGHASSVPRSARRPAGDAGSL